MEEFLSSVEAATERAISVIVVDNGSSDIDELRRIVAGHPVAQLLELNENRGYGGAMNAGIEAAMSDAKYVLIANPDVSFRPGSVDLLIDEAESTPTGGAFGPGILNVDGSLYPSARALPSLRTGIGHALFAKRWPSNPWTSRYRAASPRPNGLMQAGWLSGACILVRASAFRQVGGFDTSYFMYFEDVDLGDRLGARGWLNVYVPEARVVHTGAHSTSHSSAAMDVAHHESAYRYLSRRYSAGYLAPLRGFLRVSLALRSWWQVRKH
ncbi:MAG: glycosyltransferase family 2 protein [Cryobacterium sp.]|jgi:N-acetylglucosaminyl-diphospho-decaprenol L-rhamnosyltransferase|nr:glycosyltransferase family 2 protein [Cryobacterium sp.]